MQVVTDVPQVQAALSLPGPPPGGAGSSAIGKRKRGKSRPERKAHVEMALRVVGLADRMDHYPSQLSGGQEQRVAIARAIVTDPTILVADEPTGDLDRNSAEEIMDLMDRLNEESKKTIIMVTHDPRAAKKAHVIRHLDKGILTNADPQDTL